MTPDFTVGEDTLHGRSGRFLQLFDGRGLGSGRLAGGPQLRVQSQHPRSAGTTSLHRRCVTTVALALGNVQILRVFSKPNYDVVSPFSSDTSTQLSRSESLVVVQGRIKSFQGRIP